MLWKLFAMEAVTNLVADLETIGGNEFYRW